MSDRIAAAFKRVDRHLEPARRKEQEQRDAEAQVRIEQLQRSQSLDAESSQPQSLDEILDELEEGLMASARACVFQNGVWAVRMADASETIKQLRKQIAEMRTPTA